MRHWNKMMLGLLACLVLPGRAGAISEAMGGKYGFIVQRNAFNLHEPVPPPPPAPPPPSVKVNLTGITSILSTKSAVLVIQETGKPQESRVLREGESEGQVEVLAINDAAATVTVKICGKETTLSFEKDGIKPPTTAPAGGVPAPAVAGQPTVPQPGFVTASAKAASIPPIPSPSGGYSSPGATLAAAESPSISGSIIPSRPLRGVTGTAVSSGVSATPVAAVATPAVGTGAGVAVALPGSTGGQTLQLGTGRPTIPEQPNYPPMEAVSLEQSEIFMQLHGIMNKDGPPPPSKPIE